MGNFSVIFDNFDKSDNNNIKGIIGSTIDP